MICGQTDTKTYSFEDVQEIRDLARRTSKSFNYPVDDSIHKLAEEIDALVSDFESYPELFQTEMKAYGKFSKEVRELVETVRGLENRLQTIISEEHTDTLPF